MTNPYLNKLYNRVSNRFSEDSNDMSMTEWMSKNTTLRGKPFSIEGYAFQRAILDDMHPNMDVMKCSQIGLTEGQIRKCLGFLNRKRGVSAIFTLPNEKLYEKISKTRIQPIVKKDKVFNPEGDDKPVRSKEIMQFGDSWLYVTACTESDATSTSADAVFNDEVDISPQDTLALFNSRLQNSNYKINQRFSTPTFPSFGIDMGFLASDQHVYKVKCDACNHWNWPEFNRRFCTIPGLPDHVQDLIEIDDVFIDELDILGSYVHCEKCHRALDMGREDNREWVPRYPGRQHARGYHVTPFSTGRLPMHYIIEQLLKYKRRDYLRGFSNTVLAMPYSDGNIRLEVATIEKCFTSQMLIPQIDRSAPVWLGIDVGQTCHLVAGEGTNESNMKPFMFKTLHVDNLVQEVKNLCETYNVIGGAMDRHPYEPTADEVFSVSQGRVVPVEYRGTKDVNLVFDAYKELTHAQADRTALIDEVVRQIKSANLMMRGYQHFRSVIIEHLRDMIRDERPEEPAKWIKLTGQDHFFHALGFLLISVKIKELVRLQSKEEPRTMTLFAAADTEKDVTSILNRKKKSLDTRSLPGYSW